MTRVNGSIHGFVFDLDGTLVDSRLDFERMRLEMGLPAGTPILEAFADMDQATALRCRNILECHEREGTECAELLPGVADFLRHLKNLKLRRGVATRNSRRAAESILKRFHLDFDRVITRDDGPVKPDPWAILDMCRLWDVAPADVVVIGDFRFDIEAGRKAGATTVLLTRGRDPHALQGAEEADYLLESFSDGEQLLRTLGLRPGV